MPVSLRKNIGTTVLLVWNITESEQQLHSLVKEGDIASSRRFANAKRRTEHLAWMAALRSEGLNGEVSYTETGAPKLTENTKHIAVSHTDSMAVVIISDRPCAVDIEKANRNLSHISRRFVSATEQILPDSGNPIFPVTIWCAKEALYKFSGRKGLDFIKDLRIFSCDLTRGVITGSISGHEARDADKKIELSVMEHDGHIIVYIV